MLPQISEWPEDEVSLNEKEEVLLQELTFETAVDILSESEFNNRNPMLAVRDSVFKEDFTLKMENAHKKRDTGASNDEGCYSDYKGKVYISDNRYVWS